jgi:hypothetical protein
MEGHVEHADVRAYHSPNVSPSEQGVHKEHGEIVDGWVLDHRHFLPRIVQNPMDINIPPSNHALIECGIRQNRFT